MEGTTNMSDVVFYHAKHDRVHLSLTYQSIQSLRRYNSDLRVVLFTKASAIESVRRHFNFVNFEARALTGDDKHPYMNKWLCLAEILEMGAERALLIDADTIFYDDAAKLFDFGSGASVVSRRVSLTNPEAPASYIQVQLLDLLHARDGARPMPIFNAGMILMDRTGLETVHDGIDFLRRLREELAPSLKLYPYVDWRLLDATIYSVYFGTLETFSYRFFPPAMAPFFYELSNTECRDPGVVICYGYKTSLKGANPYADAEGSRPVSNPGGPLP